MLESNPGKCRNSCEGAANAVEPSQYPHPACITTQEASKMSAGTFTLTKYIASYGDGSNVHPIRVQPETLTATHTGTANSAPGDDVNNPISARVSTGRRALGLIPRMVTLKAPSSGQPSGYKAEGVTRIPCLTETFYNKCVKGTTVTYLGASWTVISGSPEIVR